MKSLSCGVVLINSENKILACKSFGRKDGKHDIPKGKIEKGERPVDAAIRETMEETGIEVNESELIDMGEFKYLKDKNLHLFLCKKDIPDTLIMRCSTYFSMEDKEHPEIIGYEWFDISEESINSKFYNRLCGVLNEIIKINKKNIG